MWRELVRTYSKPLSLFDEQLRDVLVAMQDGKLTAGERSAVIHITTKAHYATVAVRDYINEARVDS